MLDADNIYLGVRPVSGMGSTEYVFNGILGAVSISCRSSPSSYVDKPWYILENLTPSNTIGLWLLDQDPPAPTVNRMDPYHYEPEIGEGGSFTRVDGRLEMASNIVMTAEFEKYMQWESNQVIHTVNFIFKIVVKTVPANDTRIFMIQNKHNVGISLKTNLVMEVFTETASEVYTATGFEYSVPLTLNTEHIVKVSFTKSNADISTSAVNIQLLNNPVEGVIIDCKLFSLKFKFLTHFSLTDI